MFAVPARRAALRIISSNKFKPKILLFSRSLSANPSTMEGQTITPPHVQLPQSCDIDYTQWTQEALISRIRHLESSLETNLLNSEIKQDSLTILPKSTAKLDFDFSRYTSRLIALKFAYIGGPYQGLEYHFGSDTPLPTVEEKLFEALLKARLVPPKTYYHPDGSIDTTQVFTSGSNAGIEDIGKWIDLDSWEYTKCGRTDRGVSAFGQVVGVRVRSNRPKSKKEEIIGESALVEDIDDSSTPRGPIEPAENDDETLDFEDKDELPYVTILNRLLPSTIRVLAWCPNPPENFSARFNCQARTYHYFFTNPPAPHNPGEPPRVLDIDAMKTAAKYYEGLHDFRNLCKIDASKQITNFKRRVEEADIVKVGGVTPVFSLQPCETSQRILERRPEMYYFKLTGSAFLWHQVRHMVAILFLVGQKLEKPDVVKELLDVQNMPTKPFYNMADDRPLVLWDCLFDENEVKWVYPELNRAKPSSREDVIGSLWELWHNSNMDAMLSGGLLAMVYGQQEARRKRETVERNGDLAITGNDNSKSSNKKKVRDSTWIVDGSPMQTSFGKYVGIVKRGRMETVEVINRRFAARKSEEWRQKWSVEAKRERGIGDMTDYDHDE
ncbi:hypothetical protein TWF225_007692 [Orbilia oligospora]|nr:hypothetical protein TWF225_007692 [Orbilia oligospora]KAF3233071.1 hypothetical protein TWF128_003281 [Orbilia oligospora]KAF3246789.1 hypothetical protein TWF217_009812 [Orbilia oligospora]